MKSLQLIKDQLWGVPCKAKKIKVGEGGTFFEYTAKRNESYLLLNMGICKTDQSIGKEETIEILSEMGLVRYDDLIPILGEKKVLEIVDQLDKERQGTN